MKIYILSNGGIFNTALTHICAGVTYHGDIDKYPEALEALGVACIDVEYPSDYSEQRYDISYSKSPPYVSFVEVNQSEFGARLLKKYESAFDNFLDDQARKYRYDNRITFAMRAGYEGPFQYEATKFAQWMDACNVKAYEFFVDVSNGVKPIPESSAEFLSMFDEFNIDI